MENNLIVPRQLGLKLGAKGDEVIKLQQLLIDLRYLRSIDDALPEENDPGPAVGMIGELGVFDESTARALQAFQRDQQVAPSEVLDASTLEAMNSIFCRSGAVRTAGFIPGPKRFYSYRILNDHPALPGSNLPWAIAQAFSIWSVVTPLSFGPPWGNAEPDFTFRFLRIDGPNGEYANALVEFDSEENWVLAPNSTPNQVDFVSIALHEIGHRLGLDHTTGVPGSVMKRTYTNGEQYRILHPIDIHNITELHGRPTILDSLWIHGHSVVPEQPSRLELFQPKGLLCQVIGAGGSISNWFHFAIPTPVLNNGEGRRLHGVRLKVRTFPDSRITQIHIWDGITLLAKHWMDLGGGPSEDLPRPLDLRLGVASKPRIQTGLGISIEVKFTQGSTKSRRFEFIAAGAEFVETGSILEPQEPPNLPADAGR